MASLRLTRRGRLVLIVTVMIVATIAGITIGRSASLADSGAKPARHMVVVRAGETLWALAVRVAPDSDPRLAVAQIEAMNHLSGPAVEPGQQLLVPTTRR